MRDLKATVGVAALLPLISLAACDDSPTEPSAEEPTGESVALTEQNATDLHEKFAAIADTIPDFGGFYLDGDGQPVAYLLDPSSGRISDVESALEDVFGSDILERGDNQRRSVGSPELQLREGTYAMGDLLTWYERLGAVFVELPEEAVFTDLNERSNGLTVGVTTLDATEKVDSVLQEQEIPREAVEIVEARFPEPQGHTLRDDVDPPRGGLEIGFGSNSACTLGFVARLGNASGFITNSHCTAQRSTVDGQTFDQAFGGSQIGTETADPSWNSCYSGNRVCRRSDAAFAEYSDGIDVRGLVARPEAWAGPNASGGGTRNIDHGSPTLAVTGTSAQPVSGEMVDKVGRTTGWTWGFVNRTCFAVGVNGAPNVVMRCQYQASYNEGGGDSGSPVFVWRGDEITLLGVHWGSGATFSSLGGIFRDF